MDPEIAELLLKFHDKHIYMLNHNIHDIKYKKTQAMIPIGNFTPLQFLCYKMKKINYDYIKIMLNDPSVDINQITRHRYTAFTYLCRNPYNYDEHDDTCLITEVPN
jgi:hypothetical protein